MACIFDEDNIQLNIQFDNKYDAIKEAGKILLNRDCIEPEYIDAMIEREDKVSVYIGNGVAIPHGVGGSEKYIKKSGLSFLQIPEGIDFGDGKIAYLVIGIAGVDGEHLDILANIAVTRLFLLSNSKICSCRSSANMFDNSFPKSDCVFI